MANSIVQYANENGIQGVDINYAKNLVWGGLYDPTDNDNVFTNNLTPSEQIEAQTITANEHLNNSPTTGANNCN